MCSLTCHFKHFIFSSYSTLETKSFFLGFFSLLEEYASSLLYPPLKELILARLQLNYLEPKELNFFSYFQTFYKFI